MDANTINKPKTEKKALGRGLAALLGGSAKVAAPPEVIQALEKQEEKAQETAKSESAAAVSAEETSQVPAQGAESVEASATSAEVAEEPITATQMDSGEVLISGGGGLLLIDLNKIEPNPDQPRQSFNAESLNELAESLIEQGLIQPIIVRKLDNQKYQIIAGERRWRAARLAGFDKIAAILRGDEDTAQKNDLGALIENIQREDLNPIELAEACERLMKLHGFTQDVLSRKLGISRVSLANHLRLLRLPDNLKKFVVERRLTEGHARALLSLDKAEDMDKLAHLAIEKKMSVREVEQRAKLGMVEDNMSMVSGPSSSSGAPGSSDSLASAGSSSGVKVNKEREFEGLESELRQLFGTKVQIRGNSKGGIFEIYYAGNDSFNRILHQIRSLKSH
jgi:ParB family transcriptional regulator, chromosome partitioning protein